ncbi:hypothetical protein CEXT_33681 [Caerostris extrusa]|uniref:Uncharacterized protein n=1 Tax=Caerostris extrusa TaxID=172846 RepID=A0AAV4PQ66_CAEEX|nr:hypothetical protein CEXT_33681 [Caerostris extrusa]
MRDAAISPLTPRNLQQIVNRGFLKRVRMSYLNKSEFVERKQNEIFNERTGTSLSQILNLPHNLRKILEILDEMVEETIPTPPSTWSLSLAPESQEIEALGCLTSDEASWKEMINSEVKPRKR